MPFIGVRIGIPYANGGGGGAPVATILLPGARTLLENSAQGTSVGTFSVANGSGTYTFTLTNTAGGRFQADGVNGVDLEAGATNSDYEAATSYNIEVEADNGVDTPITRVFIISILDEAEIPSDYTPSLDFSDARNSQYVGIF
jgi:hypothetical protein